MWNRRLCRQARRGADPDGRTASPRISRLRLRRHRAARAAASCASQEQGQGARARSSSLPESFAARPASRTRAGRRTASRATATPIRTAIGAIAYAIIHNGIIENAARAARAAARRGGVMFRSETDSEVLAHLIAAMPADIARGLRAHRAAARDRDVRHRGDRCGAAGSIVVARNGSPVILGIGEHEMFVASDAGRARAPHAEHRASR